jgi:acylphosphatase
MSAVRLHVYVSGRVQGVFFRASTREAAIRFDLKGWVRNLRDGRVEAVFEGTEDDAKRMLAWCQHGPPGALINRVEETWEEATGEFTGFQVRYDY